MIRCDERDVKPSAYFFPLPLFFLVFFKKFLRSPGLEGAGRAAADGAVLPSSSEEEERGVECGVVGSSAGVGRA